MAVDDTGDAMNQGISNHGINLIHLTYSTQGLTANHKPHIKNSIWMNIFTLYIVIGYWFTRSHQQNFHIFCYPKRNEPTQYQWWLCPAMHLFIIVLREINLWKILQHVRKSSNCIPIMSMYVYIDNICQYKPSYKYFIFESDLFYLLPLKAF